MTWFIMISFDGGNSWELHHKRKTFISEEEISSIKEDRDIEISILTDEQFKNWQSK